MGTNRNLAATPAHLTGTGHARPVATTGRHHHPCCGPWHLTPWLLVAPLLGLLLTQASHADITTDGSLGPALSLPGPDFQVTADLGQQTGGNLFHSFSSFNINLGESATFSGPASVNNIISRVTGGNASNINGLLRSTIPGADMYLLNPHGVIFGDNASLDIGGSFYSSTADYLKLGDTGRFDATNPPASVLTTAPPSAFGFLGNSPASISVGDSVLQVPDGKEFALIGGDIDIVDGNLYAPDGSVALASVASEGEVPVDAASLDAGEFDTMGNISVSNPSGQFPFIGLGEVGNLDVTTTMPGDAAGGGRIVILSGQFQVEGGLLRAEVLESTAGGGIDVEATGSVSLSGDTRLLTNTFIFDGDAGNVSINAGSLAMTDDATISSDSAGSGSGGSITVMADTVDMSGSTTIKADTTDTGNGGSVTITTESLDMSDNAVIKTSTFGDSASGNAGDITVTADTIAMSGDATINSSSELGSQGQGGKVTIQADNIEMTEEAWIISYTETTRDAGEIGITTGTLDMHDQSVISTTTFFSGNGGTIAINTNQLTLSDDAIITSGTEGSGSAGNVIINADSINVADNAVLSSESEGGNFFIRGEVDLSGTTGGGAGGLVQLATNRISLSGRSGVFSGTAGTGAGGNITVNADSVILGDSSEVSALSSGAGNAGNVSLAIGQLELSGGARILTSTEAEGQGGSLNIVAGAPVSISGETASGERSGLYSSTSGDGAGGSIQLTAPALKLDDNAFISAESSGAGDAGTVTLQLDSLDITSGGQISTSAFSTGQGGELGVQAGDAIHINGDRSGLYSSTAGDGAGGSIRVEAKRLDLGSNAVITAESSAGGNAGDITVSLDKRLDMRNASIRTRADSADGGNIQITATDMVNLVDSEITTSVGTGFGDGGNITIDPEFVILNNSRIVANAFGGDGGNILIVTDNFIASADSIVDASSQFGLDGTVIIKSPEADLTSGLTELPESFLNVAALLREPCSARRSVNRSSFIVRGRSAIPPGPMSPMPVMNTGFHGTAAGTASETTGSAQLSRTGTGINIAGLSGIPLLTASRVECGL